MNEKRGLDDYITVAERIMKFYAEYPKGSLQSEILHINENRVVIKASAFRQPDDPTPGIGHAEEIRSQGPVNRTSAVENAETSAWGRAIAALGFEVKKGIASREEMLLAREHADDARERARQHFTQAEQPSGEEEAVMDQDRAKEQVAEIERLFKESNGNGRKMTKGSLNAMLAGAKSNDELQAIIDDLAGKVEA